MFALTCVLALVQGPPADPVPNDPSVHDFGLRFGGETRQIESRIVGSDLKFWTAEDGGRIRHSPGANQNWVFQNTPDDVNQTLLDVWFQTDTRGWASGRGGHLLRTTDGGSNWEHFDPNIPQILDSTGTAEAYSTLWKTRWVDNELGFINGLYTFKMNSSGSNRSVADFGDVKLWSDKALVNTGAAVGDLVPGEVEFYSLAIIQDENDPNRWTGFAAGDLWSSCASGSVRALGFYTDSELTESDGGRNWWVVFDADDHPSVKTCDPMQDAWETEFEAETGDPDNMRGYMVGGTGNQDGHIFVTTNGGKDWDRELTEDDFMGTGCDDTGGFTPTIYGVAPMADRRAIAVGYGGSVWVRNPSTSIWESRKIPGITTPIACAESSSGQRAFVAGSFGLQRGTLDAGLSWPIFLNPGYDSSNPEHPWRIQDVHFVDESVGYVCTQFQTVAKTTDGGISYDLQMGTPGINSTPSTSIVGLDFKDSQIGVAISDSDTSVNGPVPLIHVTTDGGTNWAAAAIPALVSPRLVDVEYAGGDNFFAIGRHNGNQPLILFSLNNGQSWGSMFTPPNNVRLNSLSFVAPFEGVVVGFKGARASAFRLDVANTEWDDVSPVSGPSGTERRRLLSVDSRGFSLATAEIYAVGESGAVFRYDAAEPNGIDLGRFVDVPALYDIDDVSGVLISRATRLGLDSVGMSPASTILIGTEGFKMNRCELLWKRDSSLLGQVFRFDGNAWETIRCFTNKDHRKIQLLSDDTGYLLGSSTGDHVNSELGEVGDSLLLRYEDD